MLTLFLVDNLDSSQTIEVTGDEAHHAIKVLRINLGEEILISDGNGNWVRAAVEKIEKKSFSFKCFFNFNNIYANKIIRLFFK